jgi:tetratricopeptide (TPR) repeat protein
MRDMTLFLSVSLSILVVSSGLLIVYHTIRSRNIAGHNVRGRQYIAWKMWDQAIAHFSRAIALDRTHALSHYNLGFVLYYGKREYAAAMGELNAALYLDEFCAPAHYALGHLLFHQQNMTDEAMIHLNRALEIDPRCAEAHDTLGCIEISRQHWQKAMDHFSNAIRVDARYDAAYCNMSIACLYQGRTADAVTYAEQYARLQPRSAIAHNNLGNIYGASRRYVDAIREFDASLAIDSADWIVHFWRGCACLLMKDAARAIVSFYHALRHRPATAIIHYNLALSYELLQRGDLARKNIDHAIELDPSYGRDLS